LKAPCLGGFASTKWPNRHEKDCTQLTSADWEDLRTRVKIHHGAP
jgi:hypothetical protein